LRSAERSIAGQCLNTDAGPWSLGPFLLQPRAMCGRITQKSNPKVLGLRIATLVEPLYVDNTPPRYNGAPSQEHWVIRQHPKTGERRLDRLWWGLIPNWTKEPSPKLKPINATADRVASAPMFRAAYAKRRCRPRGRSRPTPSAC
jgi:putative SOS response-associated peptidase YedK